MSISRIASQDAEGTSIVTTVTATYPGATTAGNLLIATAYSNSSSVPAIAGWTGTTTGINNNTAMVGIFYLLATGSETIITATATVSTLMKLHIYEYTGNANPISLDVAPTANGNSTTGVATFATASINTTVTTDLIFGVVSTNGNMVSPSFSGLNTRQIDSVTPRVIDGDLIPGTSDVSFSGTATLGATLKASGLIAAFKATPSAFLPSNNIGLMGVG